MSWHLKLVPSWPDEKATRRAEEEARGREDASAAKLHRPDLFAGSVVHVCVGHDERDPQPSLPVERSGPHHWWHHGPCVRGAWRPDRRQPCDAGVEFGPLDMPLEFDPAVRAVLSEQRHTRLEDEQKA